MRLMNTASVVASGVAIWPVATLGTTVLTVYLHLQESFAVAVVSNGNWRRSFNESRVDAGPAAWPAPMQLRIGRQ